MNTLGIRFNNPCNIRFSKLNSWKGQTGQYKGFCKFSSMDYGVRAVLYLLRMYRFHYGLDTIRQIVTRFAPPSENNTDAYISYVVSVCRCFGYDLHANTFLHLDFFDYKGVCVLYPIVKAMCYVESKFILTPEQFERSLKLLHE